MDTSKNNRKKKPKIEVNNFFPTDLRGKKLLDDPTLGESKEPLEKYLETEDVDCLIQAIKVNSNYVLRIPGRNSDDRGFVDASTLVWQSIYELQFTYIKSQPGSKLALEAKALLEKVLIPERKGWYEVDSGDIFIHRKDIGQGGRYRITYKNAYTFVRVFDIAKSEFGLAIQKYGDEGYGKAIRKLKRIFSKDPILKFYKFQNLDKYDVVFIKSKYIDDAVSTYLKINHEDYCNVCMNNKHPDKDFTIDFIRTLYRIAKDEVYLYEILERAEELKEIPAGIYKNEQLYFRACNEAADELKDIRAKISKLRKKWTQQKTGKELIIKTHEFTSQLEQYQEYLNKLRIIPN